LDNIENSFDCEKVNQFSLKIKLTMSNEKCFKCLVQLNDLKYLINNVYNNNDITFDIVLKEIQIKINPNLSLKTHWFEVLIN